MTVKFLSHPTVRSSPVIYRCTFLEKKGLTNEEIDEAFCHVPDPSANDCSSGLMQTRLGLWPWILWINWTGKKSPNRIGPRGRFWDKIKKWTNRIESRQQRNCTKFGGLNGIGETIETYYLWP